MQVGLGRRTGPHILPASTPRLPTWCLGLLLPLAGFRDALLEVRHESHHVLHLGTAGL